ncbi:MAG: phosphoribosylamine--glycine ligase [Rhodospirillales bacterium]|nr:phosphoribosylamine--glycine ligase [Rhodospirillales bacterium]MCB9996153.1 phosphoribosylamine--glycine ligase [Rhodospirillales bacterium]
MKVLLVGSGGREHALAWQLAQSERCSALYCAPGNAGIAECADIVPINAEDVDALVGFATDKAVDLVVVGPEAPLVLGLADRLKDAGIKVFGCSKAAAQLEGSKGFMKDLCAKYDIPTAAYGRFTDAERAVAFIKEHGAPIVLKTDGLAAGKGVIIAQSVEEACETAQEMLSGAAFGDAGTEIVIEEFLDGEELSFFALADGQSVLPLTSAQDHKRAGDGDTGPNTGGMGAYSPAHMMTEELGRKINERIIEPTIRGMAAEGCPFTGVLFAGIMLMDGEPVLLEFNVRFGDPECQPLMMRFSGDLLEVLLAGAEGRLDEVKGRIHWRRDTALCVVMAANGYPGAYEKHSVIMLDHAEFGHEVKVFHAGTVRDEQNQLVSAGGRVLGVTALGAAVSQAQANAYEAVDKITWPGGFCRRDIGWRAIEAEENNDKASMSC